jgi:hypothetical protein
MLPHLLQTLSAVNSHCAAHTILQLLPRAAQHSSTAAITFLLHFLWDLLVKSGHFGHSTHSNLLLWPTLLPHSSGLDEQPLSN